MQIVCVDIDSPLPDLARRRKVNSEGSHKEMILARLHGQPVGIIDVNLPEDGLVADQLASYIWDEFGESIRDHLEKDNLPRPKRLERTGLVLSSTPLCFQIQAELLRDAPFVSIVIATHDRLASLQECLESIYALDYPNFEVIVVDNAPRSDETTKYVMSSSVKSARLRYLREDVPGLAIAHNRALPEIKAPIVVFTDDDVLVDRNWLRYLVMNFQRDQMVGCVTGMILPQELDTQAQLWIEQFGGFGKGCKRIMFDQDENRPRDVLFPYSAGRFGSGANMAFRTSVLNALGGFDSTLGAGTPSQGGDDLAAFFDVIAGGYRLVYEPSAIIFHKHRRDYQSLVRQTHGYGVGLSAFLMRTILDKPSRLFDMLTRLPAGLKYLLNPQSLKNQKKRVNYPKELTYSELKGFLIGPLAYLRSRWRIRKLKNMKLATWRRSDA